MPQRMPGPAPGPPPKPYVKLAGKSHAQSVQRSETTPPPAQQPLATPTTKRGKKHAPEEQGRREKRLRRFEEEQAAFEREQAEDMHTAVASTSLAARFGVIQSLTPPATPPPDPNVIDWDEYTVVGTSQKLEKPYLRLTSAPNPKMVRPLATLRRTLALLRQKWANEGNYAYICDQFKSMRQDLTVQRIKNGFTVEVYETHARIALARGDLGEYNQCQSQLRSLYAYGLPGARLEFLAYRILYLLHTRNQRDVNALMSELDPTAKADPAVAHTLAVRASMRQGNFHRLFALYKDAPNMNAEIMRHFVDRERVHALGVLACSVRPACPISFLVEELRFDAESDARDFLVAQDAALYTEQGQWDTKRAMDALAHAAERHRKVDIKGQL
ncbi:hypothetical protein MVES1_002303 [Malassezia vespertilionis]|nr:uncharacterized protein MVES1_002303 [Malassezia vespertilionis]WFD06948.1 hypothetical protein MVES1_002303 [Malassezia vespertilionis]